LIPCAEQVRFAKNGTDATSAAVRLARACTGRERIAVCGYHGWQDWYIGTTVRDLGVPESVKALSESFPYDDPTALDRLLAAHRNEFAAVIMEPISGSYPQPGYLQQVLDLTHAHGALLIFDEILTGFRVHLGGAQALFDVTPDLSAVGKGMANGYPLSAVVGRREYMHRMEDIFFSGTFGGETLSLAAAKATIDKLQRDRIPTLLEQRGRRLQGQLQTLIDDQDIGDVFRVSGHPSRTFLNVAATRRCEVSEIQTLLLQELFARNILFLGTHNLSAAHSEADVDQLVGVYRELLPWLHQLASDGTLLDHLNTSPLQPLFAVRKA
jgi:glutamate-1-semialdehyde aminotransferase